LYEYTALCDTGTELVPTTTMAKSTGQKFDEVQADFKAIHDGLPESVASMDCYDVEAPEFDEEWIVGSSVTANIITRSGPLGNALKAASEENDIPFNEREYIILETRDVDRVDTDRVKIPVDMFEQIMAWYETVRGNENE